MSRRTRSIVVSVASVLALCSAGPAIAQQPSTRTDSAGSDGIGDPYFPLDGNGGYDVAHYAIEDSYDIAQDVLVGTTTITAVANQKLSRFNLDFVLTTKRVTVDGVRAQTEISPHEIQVKPATPITKGSTFTVVVKYSGSPAHTGFGGEFPFIWDGSEVQATNEPHVAPWWFPVNDHPTDKATYDITITVPKGNQVVSNGVLVDHSTAGGDTTWQWRMDEPIASYLAFFVAGGFAIRSGTANGLPYTIAASKELGDPKAHLQLLRRTPDLIAWLASEYGAYPFSSTGGVAVGAGRGFSLEDASRPTYGSNFGLSTMVHELAHQWFGDGVSVHRWRDIWLNEGFASFAVWRYDEAHGGQDAQQRLLQVYNSFSEGDPFWTVPIGDPGPNDLFDGAVYTRGEMTLQALRHRIGESDFQTLMRQWVQDHVYDDASIAQFHRLAETTSGMNLDGFFKHWLFDKQKPAKTKANGLV